MDRKKLNIQFDENIPSDNFDNLNLHKSGLCLCASAVEQVLKNSVVTRGEVEEFSQLIILKDNQIKNVEDKLSEFEIKMAVYKEKLNTDQTKIQDKEDLVKSLTLSVDLLKTINEQNNNKMSSLKTQIDNLMASDELEKVTNELRVAKDRIRDKNDVIQKLQCLKAQTTGLDNKENWRLETCISHLKSLEATNKERMGKMADLTTKTEEKDVELSKKMEHIGWLEDKVECLEQEIFKKNTELEKNELHMTNNSKLISELKEKNIELEKSRENIIALKSKVESLEEELKEKNSSLKYYKSHEIASETAVKNLNINTFKLTAEINKRDINLKKCSESLKKMETKVEGLEQELIQKNILLKDNESKMTASQTTINNLKVSVIKLNSEIKKKDIELKKMKTKVECSEQELIQKNLLLKNYETNITASQTAIENLKDNNSKLDSEIKKKDIELKKCNEYLKKMKTKVECSEQELIQKNLLLQNHETNITASQTAIENLKDNNSKLDSEIKKKDIELKKCNEYLKQMKSKVECSEQELIQKNLLLQNHETNITASQTAIENLKDNNSKLDSEIKKKDIELKKCNEYLKQMKSKVECSEQELIQKNLLLKNNESQMTASETAIKSLKDKFDSEMKKIKNAQPEKQIEVQRNLFHSKDWILIGIQKKSFDVKTMTDYHNGFSSPNGNYWVGLEKLHRLTENYFCELSLLLNDDRVLVCKNFRVGSKEDEYRLKNIGWWTGDKSIYMRKYEGGSFRIFNSSKLGWWLPESFAYSDKWLLVERTMVIKLTDMRDSSSG